MRFAILFMLPCISGAQMVAPTAVPVGTIPVVFLDGYQLGCIGDSSFQANFGSADTVLQASNLVTLYFDNCSVPNVPPIETLGAAFGQFLASLKYTNGTPVPLVDVVAHSMGGLIVRAYLSGMQVAAAGMPATFAPPRRRESARPCSLPRRTSERTWPLFSATTSRRTKWPSAASSFSI